MSGFDIHIHEDRDIRTIECTGPLTATEADRLAEAIDVCIDEGAARLNLNLRELSCADPTVFDVLASKAKQCHERGIQIELSAVLESDADDFTLNINKAGDGCSIECRGSLTARQSDKLTEAIDICINEGATYLDLDLRQVTYADPTIVDVLSMQGEVCKELGIRVGLLVGEAVRKTLNSVGFDDLVACGIELQQTIRFAEPLGDHEEPMPQAPAINGLADRVTAHDSAVPEFPHST